ncbi:conserved hypothetical protein [Talaromyces stipitatus ATCC 10500]|uniref:Cytochrome b561 domain-containing protein n=1 Tax=Talaromyces stipitatus (strain ATCC 10500 / CBS 375.48 / QM 6759 / NRRL 1006) TaxID=441959 RepID=B8MHE0_TALSN|nr:uncharacterized protein TSTA_021760 [Talaromyces stipitatus ATCC 10500]EED17119.1 conserved hypothetical protein [Talaromyces stipitatus ATCC 10500]
MPDTLSPAGSSTYASDTMYIGDGTWDSTRNTFLLPNLMGLNFDTMRYNGMGNRFRDMDGYHSMIVAHGVIATIVFLGFVPAAVMIVRYYSIYDRYWAYKYHVWLQILTLLLSTVVFVLGWFAVGPKRSLTNPHHGIGLALYVMVIFQAVWGWFSRKIERGRRHYRSPLILVLHRWIGWATVLLGIAQIPMGLTLYGSPKSLFILFAVGAFFWLALFLICSYIYDEDGVYYGPDTDSRGSYVSGPPPEDERRHSGFGRMAGAAAAGAGLAALFSRRSRHHDESDVHSSQYEDKYSDESHRPSWGKRVLEIGAIGGGIALARSLFKRRRERESDDESGRYRPTHARSDSMTEETVSRVEEGRAPSGTQGPYMHPARRQSYSSMDYSYYTQTDEGHDDVQRPSQGHGVRNAILGAGAFAAMRSLFRRRKDDDEQRRVEEIKRRDMEEERLARANSKKKYTGDGLFPRRKRPSQSVLSSDMTSDITPRPPRTPGHGEETVMTGGIVEGTESVVLPTAPPHRVVSGSATGTDIETAAAAGAVAGAAVGSSRHRRRSGSGSRRSDRRDDVSSPPVSVKVRMHNDGRHVTLRKLTEEEAAASRESKRRSRERRGSRRRGSASSLSGGEGAGSDRWRRVEEMERRQAEYVQREQAAALAAESGAAAANMPHPPPPPAPPSSQPATSFYSGPLQLPTASYAATSQHSVPPPPPGPPPPQHFTSPASHAATSQLSMPQRPPSNMQQYPPTASQQYPPTASITSPTWTGTEASADYASNRRRRRAERAQARARQQAQHSVEFT